MRKYDLGDGALYERPFFDESGAQLEGPFYIWSFGNRRQLFLPEMTPPEALFEETTSRESHAFFDEFGLPRAEHTYSFWLSAVGKAPFVLSESALKGPAIWKDPIVNNGLFFHADIFHELRKAKMLNKMKHFPCEILKAN